MLKASDGDLTSQSDSLPSSVSVHVSVEEGGCAAWHYALCRESALSAQCLQTIHQTALRGRQLCDALARLAVTHIDTRERGQATASLVAVSACSQRSISLRAHVCISVSLIGSGRTGCLFPSFVLELHLIMHKK